MDKRWMKLPDRFTPEYLNGVKLFLKYAYNGLESNTKIRCPCVKCNNVKLHDRTLVHQHLIVNGIVQSYEPWVHHGKDVGCDHNDEHDEGSDDTEEKDDIDEMLDDILRGSYGGYLGEASSHQNNSALNLASLTRDANEELYPGCKNFSKLSFIVKLLHMMSMNNWSQKSVNMLLQFLKEVLPNGAHVPNSFYEAKKVMRDLGLNYVKIDCCKNDCVIYWGPNETSITCPTCGESRWSSEKANGDKVPHKILRYFPIKPRLQRLFLNKEVASDMMWHKEKRVVQPNVLRHPADGAAWKDFDRQHETFASDPRNIRLALSSDGFCPFSNMSTTYSMWPVMLLNYNLPPWKAMKQSFFLLSLLIPGPKCPGNDIDVFLQPLIKDLQELWDDGVNTYDASNGSMFRLRAALIWTINDFPAYGNLSGWSTKGKLACPVCNEKTSSMHLSKGHKTCFMGHRRFLPSNHKWRENKSSFNGEKEYQPPPKTLSGDEVLCQLENIRPVIFGKRAYNGTGKRKREPYELNWTKKSIFFTLPYWKTLKLRHNLDVMHIEKNVAESILGTLLNIPGKTKDTINSRMDLQMLGIKKDLHPIKKGDKLVMPPACYTLSIAERKAICQYWQSLKLPDGYSSNISRSFGSSDGKLTGMKSHDYHVFLQRLLAFGIRAYLAKDVCEPLIELATFFRDLCSKTLKLDVLERMEKGIAVTLCKLERIFPPSFFDIMIHLSIHLIQEAILGGPVVARWMYPLERCMHTFKQYVRNKAQPEGSIAEAYIFNESLLFCSMYLHGIETKHNREGRNYDGKHDSGGLSVFSNNGRLPRSIDYRNLPENERQKIHLYILDNCVEIQKYVEEHTKLLKAESSLKVNERHVERFAKWFGSRVSELERDRADEISKQVQALAWGPDKRVMHYKRCIINGYRFHTRDLEQHRKTQNSGVFVQSEHEGHAIDFYGVLNDIIELEYPGGNKVALFKCDWYNVGPKKGHPGIRVDNYGLTSVNTASTWYKNQPYILASQAGQVYYVPDIKLGNSWKIVTKTTPRDEFDFPEYSEDGNNVAYQEAVSCGVNIPIEVDDNEMQLTRNDVAATEVDDVVPTDGLIEDSDEEDVVPYGDDDDDVFA